MCSKFYLKKALKNKIRNKKKKRKRKPLVTKRPSLPLSPLSLPSLCARPKLASYWPSTPPTSPWPACPRSPASSPAANFLHWPSSAPLLFLPFFLSLPSGAHTSATYLSSSSGRGRDGLSFSHRDGNPSCKSGIRHVGRPADHFYGLITLLAPPFCQRARPKTLAASCSRFLDLAELVLKPPPPRASLVAPRPRKTPPARPR